MDLLRSNDEDNRWLAWIEVQFKDIAGEDQEIDLAEFKLALGVKKSFFAERFFALFDKDGSGTIELAELMEGLHMLTKGTNSQKLKFLFDVYDVDGSGTIDQDELETVLRSCMEESSLQISDEDLSALTQALFEEADDDNSGEITFEELKLELEKHPGVMENLTISAANWLKPPAPKKKKRNLIPRYFTIHYIRNNLRKVVFLLVYYIINIGLFILSAVRYRHGNGFLIVARGFGMTLNFNCMFILVLMLRRCLSWLRSKPVAAILPLDQNIYFHKMVGVIIAIQSAGHTLAHFGNVYFLTQRPGNKFAYWEFLFTNRPNIGWIAGLAPLSGVILDIILAIMVICSMPFVRRKGHFQVFYWTHMLYVLFWGLLIIHGPIFCYFFGIPGVIFIIEKITRSKVLKVARQGRTFIKEVNLLPSKVTHLVISRSDRFRYKPGDYVFIQIPAIATSEWHPFTISSAPEMKDVLWLHVRSAGHWTNKLYEFFDNYEEYQKEQQEKKGWKHNKKNQLTFEKDTGVKATGFKTTENYFQTEVSLKPKQSFKRNQKSVKKKKKHSITTKVECFIDGPYGTPTREIFETDHAVLIGSGIGVTPFASILQSVMHRYKQSKRVCPKCENVWHGEIPEHVMKLKKVDFVWINRDQKSFEWFLTLLGQLECEQSGESSFTRFLEMHMYMTSALGKSDMKAVGLQMALEILHKRDNKDMLTGLKTKTQPGRPDWDEVFGKIHEENKGKVKVFFCGSPALSKVLKEKCEKFGFSFSKENF